MRNTTAYIPLEDVLLDASQEIRDVEFRRYGRPAYVSAAQRGLSELCHDVPWDVRHWETKIPENLIVDLPFGTGEKSLVLLFNGNNCNINNAQTLFIKPGMYHKGGEGYAANNTGPGLDITVPSIAFQNQLMQNWTYFAGESNGKLYLSPSCASFENIHVTYSGLGMECWGEDFCIPMWAREAITDYVILKAARALRQDSMNFYREVIREKEMALSLNNPSGTWIRALGYWARMDEKQRNDVWTQTTRFGRWPY